MVKNIHIIVVAAGSGTRFGAEVPKQYVQIAGRPLLMHTLDALRLALPEAAITLVIGPGQHELWQDLCREHGFNSPLTVEGGDTRWQSVKNGLDTVTRDTDIVMVHDGVRPFVTPDLLQRLITGVVQHAAAIPVVPVVDSLRMLDTNGSSHAVDRSLYRAVQTPQAFEFSVLRHAYNAEFDPLFTDDASVVESTGLKVVTVPGDPTNIKVTNPIDAVIAQHLLNA